MRSFSFRQILLLLFLVITHPAISQVTGDFQTKTATGNWNDYNAWNIYNGTTWIAAVPGQLPTATTNVFVQTAQTISVDNNTAVCNDLNLNGATSSKISFSTAIAILNVKGNINFFSTGQNGFGAWVAGARLIFSGAGMQGFTNLSVNSVFQSMEINKPSGILSTSSNLRFGNFTLTTGKFSVGSGNEIQGTSASSTININGGTWTQTTSTTRIYNAASGNTFPIGALTINGGNMVLATSTTNGGFQFSTVNIINGGTLTLNNFSGIMNIANSITVDATSIFNTALATTPLPSSVIFNGLVNYNNVGAQTIFPATYAYLKLSGSGTKTLAAGTTTIPANGTLEISGGSPSPTLLAAGTLSVSPVNTRLTYSASSSQLARSDEWHPNFKNVTVNNAAGVSMAGLSRTITGSLNLVNGTFNIGAGGSLTLDGASLTRVNGFIDGTNTSDLSIAGNTGGVIYLPLSAHMSIRNLTLSGTRTLVMDGTHNFSLNGLFNIGSGCTYDNGGESQLANSGGSIIISGKFINRDKDNFTGVNGAITTINPVLSPGCIIEYAGNGDQLVTARTDYQDLVFSGSGIKTLSNAFAPLKSVYITGNAIVKADHILGDNGVAPFTDFTMDAGRLILNAISTQPCMTGNYNLTGGVIEFANNQSTPQTIRSKSYQNIEVTGTNVRNSDGNITLNPNGVFTVKTTGIFEINDNNITGTGGTQAVIVESGAVFRCGNNQGFNGYAAALFNNSSVHKNITHISLLPGSTVEYSRIGDQPITNSDDLIYQGLRLTGSGNKIAPPGILTVQGNLEKSGTPVFLHNNGTVLLNGTGPQNFAGLTYNNLILQNNTKSTAGNSIIIDSIKVAATTTLSLRAGDTVTLHSGPAKTARVGIVEGNINYNNTGKFVVERYIPARKAWRFLSVVTSSAQTIREAWQEGAINAAADPSPGFGIQLTSDRASWMADGFDAHSLSPSIKTYDPVTGRYIGITSTNNILSTAAGGYMTFIRGNRLSASVNSPVTATVLRSAGRLFTGNQPSITVSTGKFTPVNNPFASPIDLRQLSRSSVVFYYVFDPNRGGAFGFGAYQVHAWNGADYDVVPGYSGSYGAVNNIIESGQAFFVSTLGADTSLAFGESAKSASGGAMPFTPATLPPAKLRTNLYVFDPSGSPVLADGVLHHFAPAFNNDIDGLDAAKPVNPGENLSILKQGQLLAVERRQMPRHDDTLFFELVGTKVGRYQLELVPENLQESGTESWLVDNYLETRTRISPKDTVRVDFEISNEAGTADRDRFYIVFAEASALPVTITNVKAYTKDDDVVLEWKVAREAGIKHYEIEHALNGNDFAFCFSQRAGNDPSGMYKWTHERPEAGYHYYRIRSVGLDNNARYSPVVQLLVQKNKDIIIEGGSLRDGMIHLRLIAQPKGLYALRLLNGQGQTLAVHHIIHAGGTHTQHIACSRSLPRGIYRLMVTKPDNTTQCLVAAY